MTWTQGEDITTTRKETEHMDFHYDLNSASRLYREEAFREARKRHLVERARASRYPHGGARRMGLCGFSWGSALALLRGVPSSE
jgi:ribosomal protein L37AE/L43A